MAAFAKAQSIKFKKTFDVLAIISESKLICYSFFVPNYHNITNFHHFLHLKIFESIRYFQVSVLSVSKVIKATFNFSWVLKYSVGKMNIDNEW
jgi:hypothetical protein